MGEDFKEWATIIRSCALSSKAPMTFYELNRDVKMLEGQDIPFRKLEFSSLERMLAEIPNVQVISYNGQKAVKVTPTEATAHISRMVKLQKPKKKKPRTMPQAFNYPRFNANRRPTNNYNNYNSSASSGNRYVPNRNNNNYNNIKSTSNTYKPTSPVAKSTPFQSTPPPKISTVTPPPPPQKKPPQEPLRKTVAPLLTKSVSFDDTSKPSMSQRLETAQTGGSTSEKKIEQRRDSAPAPATTKPSVFDRLGPLKEKGSSLIQKRIQMAQRTTSLEERPTWNPTWDKTNSQKSNSAPSTPISLMEIQVDPRLSLQKFCSDRGFAMPVYKDVSTKKNVMYSLVTVNSKKYYSYPKEAKTNVEAEKIAAQAALSELSKNDGKPKVITNNPEVIIDRVLGIVKNHPSGLFERCIEDKYEETFHEALPTNWVKVVEHDVTIDVGANNIIILNLPSKSINCRIQRLELQDLANLWIHIYCVYDATDIWGIIVDENHTDRINILAQLMSNYYTTESSAPSAVAVDEFYAVYDDAWHRVRCIEAYPEKKTAKVVFIDRGDTDEVSYSDLRSLTPEFCQVPSQAVKISLQGIEEFKDYEDIHSLLDKILVENMFLIENARYDISQDKYSIALSCTLRTKDTNENINNIIIKEICEKVADPRVYMTPEKVASEGCIVEVTNDSVYINLVSTRLDFLKKLINDLADNYLDTNAVKTAEKFNMNTIYLTKSPVDEASPVEWHRVRISKVISINEAEVHCVDVGCTLRVQKNNLVEVDDLLVGHLLKQYPDQAVLVRLHKIGRLLFNESMAEYLRKLAPKSESFHMKVVGIEDGVPVVHFYKRTERNLLASLSDTLLEPQISFGNDCKTSTQSRLDKRKGRSVFPLMSPVIPPVGEEFDVHISMAAHPGNFTVQPLSSLQDLQQMMAELSTVCNSNKGLVLDKDDLRVGNLVAAKYEDGRWYRALISTIITPTRCAVYYCDYGNFDSATIDQLQPLRNQFHKLPYQAIKARLHGIVPKMKDWSVKDSIRFNELVVNMSFVSIVRSSELDNNNNSNAVGDLVLGLSLIDTTTDIDIDIGNILVKENKAEQVINDQK